VRAEKGDANIERIVCAPSLQRHPMRLTVDQSHKNLLLPLVALTVCVWQPDKRVLDSRAMGSQRRFRGHNGHESGRPRGRTLTRRRHEIAHSGMMYNGARSYCHCPNPRVMLYGQISRRSPGPCHTF
jgi:hypothetical protein